MQRSARHGNSLPRRGVLAAVALASGVAMAVTGLATGASASDRGGSHEDGGGHDDGHSSLASVQDDQKAVGLYVYLKRDASQHGSWENSTQQYLVRAWVGDEYGGVTLEEAQAAVDEAGLEVCGAGEWGVQQDKVYGGVEVFTDNPAPSYPESWIGWVQAGGPIYEAAHWNLDDFFDVPECVTDSPTATPSTPVVVPTTEPTPVVPVEPATEPSETAVPVVTPSATPSASPTEDVVTVVLPAPSSVETEAPVVTEVLADETAGTVAGAQLASTGAAPLAGAVAAVLLLAAGGVLLVLRRRGAAR